MTYVSELAHRMGWIGGSGERAITRPRAMSERERRRDDKNEVELRDGE